MAAAAEDDSGDTMPKPVLNNGELSFAYRDIESIPEEYATRYGSMTRRLDLSNNCLKSLASLAKFTALKELILDSNDLGEDGLTFPEKLPDLETLSINKNQIAEVEPLLLQLKKVTPSLRFLSLLGNAACPNELMRKEEEDYQRYRYLVLFHLPNLKFLDSRPVTPAEVKEAARVGEYMRVVRYKPEDEDESAVEEARQETGFNPLPQEERPADGHKGTLSTCKYVYYGRHSEGNRFIRNNDL